MLNMIYLAIFFISAPMSSGYPCTIMEAVTSGQGIDRERFAEDKGKIIRDAMIARNAYMHIWQAREVAESLTSGITASGGFDQAKAIASLKSKGFDQEFITKLIEARQLLLSSLEITLLMRGSLEMSTPH
jgi:hypothetical protein